MITNFFYWVADMFQYLFDILPYIGRFINVIWVLIGFVGTFYWLNYAKKHRLGKKGNI
jgi:hypothetical protein